MVARIVRAVMPFADEPRHIAGALQQVSDSPFTKCETIEPARFERVDDACAMRIAAGHQRGSRRRANGRSRVVLRQGDAVADEMVERGCARRAVVEASEVAVAHVVGEDKDDVRLRGHTMSLNRCRSIRDRVGCESLGDLTPNPFPWWKGDRKFRGKKTGYSRSWKPSRLRDLPVWRSLRSAFASIWRMRSRVTANCLPTSSRV